MAIKKFQLKQRSDAIIDRTYERMKSVALAIRQKGERGITQEEVEGIVSKVLCDTANDFQSLINKIDIE